MCHRPRLRRRPGVALGMSLRLAPPPDPGASFAWSASWARSRRASRARRRRLCRTLLTGTGHRRTAPRHELPRRVEIPITFNGEKVSERALRALAKGGEGCDRAQWLDGECWTYDLVQRPSPWQVSARSAPVATDLRLAGWAPWSGCTGPLERTSPSPPGPGGNCPPGRHRAFGPMIAAIRSSSPQGSSRGPTPARREAGRRRSRSCFRPRGATAAVKPMSRVWGTSASTRDRAARSGIPARTTACRRADWLTSGYDPASGPTRSITHRSNATRSSSRFEYGPGR